MHFCLPPAPFYEPYLTKKKLLALAEELQLAPVPPTLLEKFSVPKRMPSAIWSRNISTAFSASTACRKRSRVVACPSLQEEIRFAAGKILRLVREEGLRFRQIAIVTNAMETYEKSLRGILEEYDIPCFIDARRETTAHPLVTLLTSLLDILVYDFKYETVFPI